MILSPASIMQSFHETTEVHSLWHHEFLLRCQAEQLTFLEIRLLAVQMYKFSKEFSRILAGILSCCPEESAQLVIMENLFDEMGRGDFNNSHPELFRRFTRALGISDQALMSAPIEPETQALIETYINLPHRYGYLAALGAVCFASEGIVRSLYTQLYRGIVGVMPVSKEALAFFEIHIDVDDSHAAKLAKLIEPRVVSNAIALEIDRAIFEAMDARVRFFDGVQRSILWASGLQLVHC